MLKMKLGRDERGYIEVDVLKLKTHGMLDCGAVRTVMGYKAWKIFEAAGLKLHASKRYKYIITANHGTAKIEGEAFVPFNVGGITRVVRVLYVPRLNSNLILGIDFWRRFHLRPDFVTGYCEVSSIQTSSTVTISVAENGSVLNVNQKEELRSIIEEFKPKLEKAKLGCLKNVVHHIDTGDAPPCKQKYCSLNPKMLAEAHRELDERLEMDIVEPSESPYSSPLLMLPKKDSGWRWVVDFRELNKAIKRPNAHPLPKIDPMLWNVKGGTIFSSIDIKDAYLQVPLSPESKSKTAFSVPGRGLFQYKRLPAGLKDAAGRWQKAIEEVLGHDPNILIYMDDILIFSSNWEHHKQLLRKVFQKLSEAGLTIKMSKCSFGLERVTYLGHVIDRYGVRPDPSKIAAVVNFPSPINVKKVRQFLGLAGWMRKFVPSFSVIARPLYKLLQGDVKFRWGSEQEVAFNELKQRLCTAPVLRSPDFSLPFRVYTDGSADGTGGILAQTFLDGEHVIAYTSKSLKGREKNFSATELECLAVLHAVEAFRPYLEGYSFEVVTDHSSLQWLYKLKNPSGRLARWACSLQQYDFFITHRKGKFMEAPDALSRNPIPADSSEDLTLTDSAADINNFSTPVHLIDLPTLIEDEWYLNLLKAVQEEPEKYEKFQVKDGVLYKLITVSPYLPIQWVQVIPQEGRNVLLQKCHDDPTSGHTGIFKTFGRLRLQGYWPEMKKSCIDYVKRCQVCQEVKKSKQAPAGLMGCKNVISAPFEVLSTDLIGPLTRSSSQNTYLSVTTDFFSKYVFLKPLREATAKKLIKHFKEDIILVHGAPKQIIVDNGSQYRSKEFKKMCKGFYIDLYFNIAYNPRHNPTERTNQTIENMICSYIRGNQKKWDENLHELQYALRSGLSSATGHTPHEILFGKTLLLDGRHHLLQDSDLSAAFPDIADPAEHTGFLKQLEHVRDDVIDRLQKAQDRSAERFNSKRRDVSFKVGMKVWRKNIVKSDKAKEFSKKLAPRWRGPFKIKKKVGKYSYILDAGGGEENGPWHIDQLKRHYM